MSRQSKSFTTEAHSQASIYTDVCVCVCQIVLTQMFAFMKYYKIACLKQIVVNVTSIYLTFKSCAGTSRMAQIIKVSLQV